MSHHSQQVPTLSIVLPFHNEAESVRELFQRLFPVLGRLGLTYEIICVDDGSADRTYSMLCHEREHDLRIKPVRLARNFGKEAALTCGLALARGEAVITMDSDLQHPPETIPELVAAWRGGAKMVYATRKTQGRDSFSRTIFSRLFYIIFKHIADIRLPEGAGDYRLLDRAVVEAVKALPERNRFMKGLMTWVGFEYAIVPFVVEPRTGGRSKWSFFRLVQFAFDGLTAFSTFPLRMWTWFGFFIASAALIYGIYLVLDTLFMGVDVPGFASIMVGTLFMGGIQLMGLGFLGEYISRIFIEVKGRPIYLVADKRGFEPAELESR